MLHLHPLLRREARPDVVRLRDRVHRRTQNRVRLHRIRTHRTQNQNQTAECCVRRDRLQPVVVQVEQVVAWTRRLQHVVRNLLHLRQRRERKLHLTVLQHAVREVYHLALHCIHQVLACHDDLTRLLLHWHTLDDRRQLLRRLPLRQLCQTLLTRPHRRVNHLQEELTRPRVHDRDEAIHRLRRHVALERVVHRYTVHVRVVHKPRDLVTEQLVVVLTAQHRLRRFRRV